MRPARRIGWSAALLALALGAAAGAVRLTDEPTPDGPVVLELSAAEKDELTIGAVPVTGLYPGATRPIRLAVHNPYAFKVALTAVSGAVASTSDPRCAPSAANLVVDRHAGTPTLPVLLAPRLTTGVGQLPVRMPKTAANACQGVTFIIRLSASGRKA